MEVLFMKRGSMLRMAAWLVLPLILVVVRFTACQEPDMTVRALEGEGYEDVELHGTEFFSCSEPSCIAFTAVREGSKKKVRGVVGCSTFAGCTVRLRP
jgi:hypothetical protein